MIGTRFVRLRCNIAVILPECENRSRGLPGGAGDDADRLPGPPPSPQLLLLLIRHAWPPDLRHSHRPSTALLR